MSQIFNSFLQEISDFLASRLIADKKTFIKSINDSLFQDRRVKDFIKQNIFNANDVETSWNNFYQHLPLFEVLYNYFANNFFKTFQKELNTPISQNLQNQIDIFDNDQFFQAYQKQLNELFSNQKKIKSLKNNQQQNINDLTNLNLLKDDLSKFFFKGKSKKTSNNNQSSTFDPQNMVKSIIQNYQKSPTSEIFNNFKKQIETEQKAYHDYFQKIKNKTANEMPEQIANKNQIEKVISVSNPQDLARRLKILNNLKQVYAKNPWIYALAKKLGNNLAKAHHQKKYVSGFSSQILVQSDNITKTNSNDLALDDEMFYLKFLKSELNTFEGADIEDNTSKNLQPWGSQQGDVVLIVDVSGSMCDWQDLVKTIITAIINVIDNKRKIHLVYFSLEVFSITIDKDFLTSKDYFKFLDLTFDGGTDISKVIEYVLTFLEKNKIKNSDILLVSDFNDNFLSQELVAKLNSLTNTKLLGINVDETSRYSPRFLNRGFHDIFTYQPKNIQAMQEKIANWKK